MDGRTVEISSSVDGRVAAGAAVSPDGQRIAVPVQSRAATTLYILDIDGRVGEATDIVLIERP